MSDDTITITCHFALGSAALGCHIQFLATEQDNEYEECTMRAIWNKGTSQNLSETISGLPAGTYNLMVHDIEGNSFRLSETHAYQHPSIITSNGIFPGMLARNNVLLFIASGFNITIMQNPVNSTASQ